MSSQEQPYLRTMENSPMMREVEPTASTVDPVSQCSKVFHEGVWWN